MHTTLKSGRAAGHRDVAFCNTACGRCDAEMAVRTARYERMNAMCLTPAQNELRRLMESAPAGR